MATLAMLIALGGASYAAIKLPKNSVGAKQLKKSSVTSVKVKDRSLTASELKAGAIPASTPPGTSYTKPESDGRYLRGTITVVKTISANLEPEESVPNHVDCPAGYQALSGGVEPENVTESKISGSGPIFGETEAIELSDGQHGPGTGWFGAVTTQGASLGSGEVKLVVVCAPLG